MQIDIDRVSVHAAAACEVAVGVPYISSHLMTKISDGRQADCADLDPMGARHDCEAGQIAAGFRNDAACRRERRRRVRIGILQSGQCQSDSKFIHT